MSKCCCAVQPLEPEENSIALDMIREYNKKLKLRSILCLVLFAMWVITAWCFSWYAFKDADICEESECQIISTESDVEQNTKTNTDRHRKRKHDSVKLRIVARETR